MVNFLGLSLEITDVPYAIANALEIIGTIVYIVLIFIALDNFKEDQDAAGFDFDGRIRYFLERAAIVSCVSLLYYPSIFLSDEDKNKLTCNMKSLRCAGDAAALASYGLVGASLIMVKAASWMSDLYSAPATLDTRDMANIAFYLQVGVLGFRVLKDSYHSVYVAGGKPAGYSSIGGGEA